MDFILTGRVDQTGGDQTCSGCNSGLRVDDQAGGRQWRERD